MKTITLFSKTTGEFSSVLALPDNAVKRNVPAGFDFKIGRFDKFTQRVDLESGEVAAYRSPKLDERENAARAVAAQARIDDLERKQNRALRELVLNGDEKARERLAEIDAEIAALRQE